MPHFQHENAICETAHVGDRTRIWAFTHILPGARIGDDCNICDHVFIENNVLVGNRVTVKCGVQLWDGVTVEDDVFIGPNVTFSNDKYPKSKIYPKEFAPVVLKARCSIGANATLLPDVTIGEGALVGAGSVVTRNVPANAVVAGNPARIIGYQSSANVSANPAGMDLGKHEDRSLSVERTGIGTSAIYRFKQVVDMRGSLIAAEMGDWFPFSPKRFFIVHSVPSKEIRGEHAHRLCDQFLVCVSGSCKVLLDDGRTRKEVTLDSPSVGVYMPSMIWGTQYDYSKDAVLFVFASEHYQASDYIRTYEEFLREVDAKNPMKI